MSLEEGLIHDQSTSVHCKHTDTLLTEIYEIFSGGNLYSMKNIFAKKNIQFKNIKSLNPTQNKYNKKTLCVITIAMICSSLASLWKFQYFRRSIYNPVEHLWWSFYCKNSEPLSIFTKSSIIDACLGSKYTFAFWRLFKHFISLKNFTL